MMSRKVEVVVDIPRRISPTSPYFTILDHLTYQLDIQEGAGGYRVSGRINVYVYHIKRL